MLDALAPLSADNSAHGGQQQHAFIPEPSWTLAETAEVILWETFASRRHDPSPAHREALREILATLQSQADGTAEPRVSFAPVSPGIGKSSCLVAFAAALTSVAAYSAVGMAVCVGRVAEAVDLARDMHGAGFGSSVAVIVSKDKASEASAVELGEDGPLILVTRGGDDAEQDAQARAVRAALAGSRQILIITQARVAHSTKWCGFRDVAEFRFGAEPRRVVAWDESWSGSREVVLDRMKLARLWDAAASVDPRFQAALERLTMALPSVEHGGLIDVPDWRADFDVDETDLLDALAGSDSKRHDDDLLAASGLFVISGQPVRVFHDRTAASDADEGTGKVLLSYKDTLPTDLLPVLVLDASALVRQTYANCVEFRSARMLKPAQQDYHNLRCHVWARGGGKTAFRKNGPVLVEGVVKTILGAPNDRWLIVHHRSRSIGFNRKGGFERAIRDELPTSLQDRVAFTTWGAHQASNAWRDYERVLLAGTLFLPESQYAAMTSASRAEPPAQFGLASPEEVRKVRDGEHRHAILQAGLRGRARQCDGDSCKAMDLYVIASSTSGVPAQIPSIFPGCHVERWCPVEPPMRGKVLDAATILDRFIADHRLDDPCGFVTLGQIAAEMPGRDGQPLGMRLDAFTRDVCAKDAWQDFVASRELSEDVLPNRRGKASRVLRRASEAVIGGVEGP